MTHFWSYMDNKLTKCSAWFTTKGCSSVPFRTDLLPVTKVFNELFYIQNYTFKVWESSWSCLKKPTLTNWDSNRPSNVFPVRFVSTNHNFCMLSTLCLSKVTCCAHAMLISETPELSRVSVEDRLLTDDKIMCWNNCVVTSTKVWKGI